MFSKYQKVNVKGKRERWGKERQKQGTVLKRNRKIEKNRFFKLIQEKYIKAKKRARKG